MEHLDEAAVLLTKCLNDEDFQSKKGISRGNIAQVDLHKIVPTSLLYKRMVDGSISIFLIISYFVNNPGCLKYCILFFSVI